MKILHVITGLLTGGAESTLYNLLNGGLAKYFSNQVISLSDDGTMGPSIRELGVPVTTLGMRRGRPSLTGLRKLHRQVTSFQPELIQGWMYHGNLAAFLAPRSPILAWNIRHSLYDLEYEKPMTRQVIRANKFFSSAPDVLIYNSQISLRQHETFGFESVNGQIIPNGIDVQRFCFSCEAREHVRSELGIPPNALVIGHVARLHPMKDHPSFVRAAADLSLRYPHTHFMLSGRDVSLESEILEQLVPIQARDRFHLLGERGDVSDLMSAMDIFCVSSAWGEGFSNVVGEAMATGVPCVATDVGDSAIIIGETGVVVPPRSEDALAAGIEKILVMRSEDRVLLGARARARIAANYALETIVERYAALYEQLISEQTVC